MSSKRQSDRNNVCKSLCRVENFWISLNFPDFHRFLAGKSNEWSEEIEKNAKNHDCDSNEDSSVVSIALELLTKANKEKKHEMNIQKLLVCSEMWR